MMHSTEFEPTEGGLVLSNAILLYRGSAGHDYRGQRAAAPAFASIHSVEHMNGRPTIAAGAPLSRAHLRQWTAALGRGAAPELLPDNALVSHPDMLAWWVPEKVRASYFALASPPKELKALAERTTLPLPYPAHLFIATRGRLGVYALPTNSRPSADTVVLHSPVLNVYINGDLCWGSIPQPKTLGIASMAEFESAVFDSWSTHPNHGQEATVTGKGGLVRLWDELAARKASRFPVKRMKPFRLDVRNSPNEPVTLGKLIAASVRA